MKKKMLMGVMGLVAAVTLVGCEEGTIVYEEKEMPISDAEERIADKLEVENPDKDIEIDIYEETD